MKSFFVKILLTLMLPVFWWFQESHWHICSWRCAGLDHDEPIKFFQSLKNIWKYVK